MTNVRRRIARERIAARSTSFSATEWQFSLTPRSRQLLIALARRYRFQPYRYRRQRHTTLSVRAPERFLKDTFLPQYDQICDVLHQHLDAVTEHVIADVLHVPRPAG